MHSIKGGMAKCQSEMKKAVDLRLLNLFRLTRLRRGQEPFTWTPSPRRRLSDF